MYEFSFADLCPQHLEEAGAQYIAQRLKKLAGIAAILQKANWETWLTVSGVAFEPPGIQEEDCCNDCFQQKAVEQLRALGVVEAFNPWSGPTLQAIQRKDLIHGMGQNERSWISDPSRN
jgi:hypothetical protein